MMIALVLTALFASATLLALLAMADSWKQYGAQVLALRRMLQQCDRKRSVEYRIVTDDQPGRGPAQVFLLPVRPAGYRPALRPALRAAA